MGIRLKLILLFLLISLIPMILLGAVVYGKSQKALTAATLDRLESVAGKQEQETAILAERYRERVSLLASRVQVRQGLTAFVESGGSADTQMIRDNINTAKASLTDFRHITVLDPNGAVVASTDPGQQGQSQATAEYFDPAKSAVTPPLLTQGSDGQLVVTVAGPVTIDNRLVGIVVLHLDGAAFKSIAMDYTGLGETGETYLVRATPNGGAMYLTPLRFEPDSALQKTVPPDIPNRAALTALENQEGTFGDQRDYRDQKVLIATRYLESTDWGLVAKIDQAEAFRSIDQLRTILLLLGTLLAGLIAIFIVEVTRSVTRPILKLTTLTERLGQGQLGRRAAVRSKDELGRLARSINEMADQLQAAQRGLRSEVEQQQARLVAVVESSDDAVISTDQTGRITSWNPGATKLYGYTAKAAIGRSISLLLPKGQTVELAKTKAAIQDGRTVRQEEALHLTKAGDQLRVSLIASPIRNNGRKVSGASVIIRDISHQYELQEMQRDFVSIASHELRTPITALRGYLSLVGQQKDVPADSRRFFGRALAAADRLSLLVEDLLNVSKLEEDRLRLQTAPLNPVKVLTEVVETFRKRAAEKELTLSLRSTLVPGIRVEADRGRLEQILTNLIDNAIKYTPAGGRVTITAKAGRRAVEILIADTGIGIHPDNLANIFDKFYREHSPLSVEAGGTGLGLFITRELTERMGGQLAVTSKQGKGSTVRLSFPRTWPKPRRRRSKR